MTPAQHGNLLDGVAGVLLDIDDTLVDTRAAFGSGIAAIARVYLPDLNEDGITQALGLWRSDPSGHYRAHTRGELTMEAQRLLRANEVHERFGGPILDGRSFPTWDAVFREGSRRAGWRTRMLQRAWRRCGRRGSPSGH